MDNPLLPTAPLWLDMALVLLTLVLAVGWIAGLHHSLVRQRVYGAPRIRMLTRATSVVLIWLVVTAVGADFGWFADFEVMPPRVGLALGLALAFCIWFATSGFVGPLLRQAPPHWLLHAQAFRIVMEVLLWAAYQAGAAPALITWEGRNWDLIAGLAALAIGEWVRRRGMASARLGVLLFHAGGLALLVNVVVHALLAAPTPFQSLFVEPSTAIVAGWPWIWLPTFIVPTAVMLHVLSLRQVLMLRQSADLRR